MHVAHIYYLYYLRFHSLLNYIYCQYVVDDDDDDDDLRADNNAYIGKGDDFDVENYLGQYI
jgi:hypothetical protein